MKSAPLVALALLLGASGCGGASPSRDDVLRSLKQETVVPGFEHAREAAAELEAAIAGGMSNGSVVPARRDRRGAVRGPLGLEPNPGILGGPCDGPALLVLDGRPR